MRRSKRALKKWKMVQALDAAARQEIVEDRDHCVCQRCGKIEGQWDEEMRRLAQIQWAHVHTREYYVTRWEPDNSLALCDRCHVWFDNHKVLSYEWFRVRWPERWRHIQNVLQSGTQARESWIREMYQEVMADAQN